MLSRPPAMSGAVVRGIDPALEPSVSTIADSMREGNLEDLSPGANRIVLGRMLAYQLQVGVGDTVTVMIAGQRSGGAAAPRSCRVLREFTVAGIFEVGLQEHDSCLRSSISRMPRRLRGLVRSRPASGSNSTTCSRRRNWPAAPPRRGSVRDLNVRDWTQENEAYFHAIRIEKTMMALILMLIVAVAAFNIVATLVMVVSDKRTDIAILRTLGMTPRGVLAVFMTQGCLIGWLGTAHRRGRGRGAVALDVRRSSSRRSACTSWIRMSTTLRPSERDASARRGRDRARRPAAYASSRRSIRRWQASKTQPAEALRYE